MRRRCRAQRLPRHLVRPGARRPGRRRGAGRRLGPPPPRPRRPDLHRPARPHRHRPARLPPRQLRRRLRAGPRAAGRGRAHRRRARWSGARMETVNPELPTGEVEMRVAERRAARRRGDAALPDRGLLRRGRRGRAPAPPLPRPAPRADARGADAAPPGHRGDARVPRRRGLPRRRDPGADPLDPRGRPRLPRPQPPAAGLLLRAAAVAAAVQAAADGRRVRALLPGGALLPRRATCAPTASPSSPSSTSRCPSSTVEDVHRGQRTAAGPRLRAGRRSRRSSCRCGACATTRRWAGSAPTGPTCASGSSWSTSARPWRETEFKVFRSVIGRRRRDPRHQRRPARDAALGARRLISRAQELGAKGLVWAFREGEGWRSPTAKFLTDGGAGRRSTSGSAPRRATCCCWSPTSARSPTRCSARCGSTSAERFGLIDPERATSWSGSSTGR